MYNASIYIYMCVDIIGGGGLYTYTPTLVARPHPNFCYVLDAHYVLYTRNVITREYLPGTSRDIKCYMGQMGKKKITWTKKKKKNSRQKGENKQVSYHEI